jgi:hypothetical protein
MAGRKSIELRPRGAWLGLDLRASDLLRNSDAFTVARNVILRRTGSLTSRNGFKVSCGPAGGLGTAKYTYVDKTTGAEISEILVIGQSLYRVKGGTFTITYSGTATSVTASMMAEGTTWSFSLSEDGSLTDSFDLGLGYEEATPYDLADLKADIDSLTNFAASISGDTALPAAFLPTFQEISFDSGVLAIDFEYLEQVHQPTGAANPFAATWANRNQPEFEFVTSCNGNNVLYLGSRYDYERKYDGQKIYRSSLPKPATPSATVVSAVTGRTGTNIRYRISYVQVDRQGNRFEGNISDETGAVSPSADHVNVTYTKLSPSSGYNTDCAIVNGNQSGVTTIVVDSGHTLKVGDTAYFYDGASSSFVERKIINTTATTIVIAGANVNVSDDAPISANLRVALYTQAVAGGDYYLVSEYPHDSITATTVVKDTGVALGALYFFPDAGTDPGEPPKCQYRAIYRGLKFLAGNAAEPDKIYRSDISSLEAYPTGANTFGIVTNRQARLTGLFPTNEYLLITKSTSCHQLIGDFDAETSLFRYRVDDLSLTVGCTSWATIHQIADGSLFFANDRGIYRIGAGSLPMEVSQGVFPLFTPYYSNQGFNFNRMQAYFDSFNNQYVLFIPNENSNSGNIYSTQLSRTLCADLIPLMRGETDLPRFTEWENIDFSCGAVVNDKEIYFAGRRFDSVNSTVQSLLFKFLNSGTGLDKVDHLPNLPGIELDIAPGWDDLGDPSVLKSPLRIKVFSIDAEVIAAFTMELQTEINFSAFPVCQNTFTFGGTGISNIGYSLSPYSTSPYGSPIAPEIEQKVGNIRCSSFRPRIRHSRRYEVPIISGWQWEVALNYSPNIKE